MPTKAEFAQRVRDEIERLKGLADEAASISGVTQAASDEAAEFLHEAIADCEDAIGSLNGNP